MKNMPWIWEREKAMGVGAWEGFERGMGRGKLCNYITILNFKNITELELVYEYTDSNILSTYPSESKSACRINICPSMFVITLLTINL